ncbi:MAG TPA: nickel-dependent lactate racemase [Fastidiosipila sp.]|nr:nickel-dependent lactate racemase [Fastidiosipila sp.]
MLLELGYDKRTESVSIPDERLLGVLVPNEIEVSESSDTLVQQALENPIGSDRLRAIVKPGEKVCIITSDVTRPLPSSKILPFVLAELNEAGIPDDDIFIVFALGAHRPHTKDEMIQLVGQDVFERVACYDSTPDDVVHMGETKSGTPIDITRRVAEADRRIGLANIEYHYFAGYSGGAKCIMPGVSTRQAIAANHRFMVHPQAVTGNVEMNPVRDDLEEAISYCPLDFIVNVVLDEKKRIVHAVAGHFIKAHRAGCEFLDTLYMKPIQEKADIVIVSQGGYPKDINLYQTQKALDNAKHAVKDGGIIIVVGSCKEGMGEEVFATWMKEATSPKDLTDRIKRDFQLGGHKAAAIALVLDTAEIYLVSDMPADEVREMFMEPYASLQEAFDAATEHLPEGRVLVMPYGGSTLPRYVESE